MEQIELTMDAIVDSLRASLPTKLEELNGRVRARHPVGDPRRFDVDVLEPEKILFGGAPIVTPELAPFVEVAIPDGNATDDGDLHQLGYEMESNLIVRFWNTDPDFERLYRTSLRYLAAIYNVLTTPGAEADPDEGSAIDVVGFRFAFRVDPEQDDREEFFQGGVFALNLGSSALRQ